MKAQERKREKSTYLFDLVKSLSGQEKRYFSLFSKRHILSEDNNYIKLFSLLCSQQVYNENEIVERLSNKKFASRLDTHKKILTELILKSLRVFHSGKTHRMELSERVNDIELLIYKKQWRLCEKYIKQAKHFALSNDLFTGYIDILGLELMMMQSSSNLKWLKNNINTIQVEENKVLEKQANYFQYRRHNNLAKIWIVDNSAVRSSENSRRKFDEAFNSALTKDVNNVLSDKAMVLYHHLNGQRFYFLGDYKRSLNHFQLLQKFIKSAPGRFKQYPKVYTAAIHNIINILQRTGKFNAVIRYINKLKHIPTGMELSREEIFVRYFEQLLCTYVYFGKFVEGIKKVNEVEIWLEQTNIKLIEKIRLIELYLYLSYLYFGTGNYKRSLFYCNRIQRIEFKPEVLKDQHYYSKVIAVMNHFELGNEDICVNLARTLLRNKKENKLMTKTEKVVMEFIYRGNFALNSKVQQRSAFSELKRKVLKISNNISDMYTPEQFDFLRWLNSKIQDRPFANVISKKS